MKVPLSGWYEGKLEGKPLLWGPYFDTTWHLKVLGKWFDTPDEPESNPDKVKFSSGQSIS